MAKWTFFDTNTLLIPYNQNILLRRFSEHQSRHLHLPLQLVQVHLAGNPRNTVPLPVLGNIPLPHSVLPPLRWRLRTIPCLLHWWIYKWQCKLFTWITYRFQYSLSSDEIHPNENLSDHTSEREIEKSWMLSPLNMNSTISVAFVFVQCNAAQQKIQNLLTHRKQERSPAWTQEAYRLLHTTVLALCSWGGGGGHREGYLSPGKDQGPETGVPPFWQTHTCAWKQ